MRARRMRRSGSGSIFRTCSGPTSTGFSMHRSCAGSAQPRPGWERRRRMRRGCSPNSKDVRWQCGNVMELPFADATFDRPAAFAEVARVLRPGGVFLSTSGTRSSTMSLSRWSPMRSGACSPTIRRSFWPACRTRTSTRPRSRQTSQPAGSFHRHVSQCWRLGAGHGRPRSRRSPSARAHPCETRSKPDTHHVLPRQPRSRQQRSKNASERRTSTARSAPSSSPRPSLSPRKGCRTGRMSAQPEARHRVGRALIEESDRPTHTREHSARALAQMSRKHGTFGPARRMGVPPIDVTWVLQGPIAQRLCWPCIFRSMPSSMP
jgi:hypothetical protein